MQNAKRYGKFIKDVFFRRVIILPGYVAPTKIHENIKNIKSNHQL